MRPLPTWLQSVSTLGQNVTSFTAKIPIVTIFSCHNGIAFHFMSVKVLMKWKFQMGLDDMKRFLLLFVFFFFCVCVFCVFCAQSCSSSQKQ